MRSITPCCVPFSPQLAIHARRRLVHGAEGAQRIQDEPHARTSEFLAREERRPAELGDVGQHGRGAQGRRELAVLLQCRQRLGENHVGPGGSIGLRPRDGRGEPFAGVSIRPRHDDEGCVGARIHRRLHAVAHFLRADEFLAGPMAAALGLHLVLKVTAGGARARELANRPRNHERTTPAGIGIDQQGQRRRRDDAPRILADVVERGEPEVRQAEGRVGHARAGKIKRAEPRARRLHGAIGIDRPDDLQRPLEFQGGAKSRAGGFVHAQGLAEF